MTKVSAIVTTYNVQEYVAPALQSAIDAGFDELELIVVDDGSTDRTRAIVDAIAAQPPAGVTFKLIYFSQNTVGGVASAANAGMDTATGDVILFIDGDDWIVPANANKAVRRLIENGDDFIVTDCQEYGNRTGRYVFYPEGAHWDCLPDAVTLEDRRSILLHMAPFPWRKIYRRSFIEEFNIRFPMGDFFFEDNPFHWHTTSLARSFSFMREVTHVHRTDREGQTIGAKGIRFMKIFDHAAIIRRQLEDWSLFEKHRMPYVNWLLRHVTWCAAHVPPSYLNEVFERSKPMLRALTPDIFWSAVATSGFSASDVRKVAAIYLDQRFEFLREF